uniref:Plac8 onzin related protein 3 n=1 Tax=Neolamprologus brichardi TaxID=32507 RepID=A0A3Q4H8P3_NEOBR
MTSKMVVRQPQPMMYSQESNEWSSGICDCCQDVPGCKCLLIIFKVYRGLLLCCARHTSGTMCRDCVLSTFCCACSWCQMSREMKSRNVSVVMVGAKNS